MGFAERPLESIYMHTSSGKKYYPFAPKSADVNIHVIAHHLATKGRWNGATIHPVHRSRIFYSVAEHSVYVSRYVEEALGRPDLAMAALLHDAAEAYNGDLIRPLKHSREFAEPFKRVERMNEAAVIEAFNLGAALDDPAIKQADEAVCNAEWIQIVPRDSADFEQQVACLHDDSVTASVQIEMLLPHEARDFFLDRFYQLWNELVQGRVGLEPNELLAELPFKESTDDKLHV